MVCKPTTNYALGGANVFQKRGSCQTYPTGYLYLTSPEVGAIEIAGVSPLSVTMQLKVGASIGDDVSDWGTLTGWCVSWGDGTSDTGSFGSATPDFEGFMYHIVNNISHAYKYDDTTTDYTSRAYRPWATISDTCGNEIVIDYGQYIHVCRSDAAPDRIGGCTKVVPDIKEIIGTPPKEVCTHGDKLCIRYDDMAAPVGYFCQDGSWTFDPNVDTQCREQNMDITPNYVCTDGIQKCDQTTSILYTCKNNAWVPGESCGKTPIATTDDHDCVIGSQKWCDSKQRCVNTQTEDCCITGSADSHGCICLESEWCDLEKTCKPIGMACSDIGAGLYDDHRCRIGVEKWCDVDGCVSLGAICTPSNHYQDGHNCWADTEHWCQSDLACKSIGQQCTPTEQLDENGCTRGVQKWCASGNKCISTDSSCGGSGTGGNGGGILDSQTFGIDNTMLAVVGATLIGVLILFGGSKSGSKK